MLPPFPSRSDPRGTPSNRGSGTRPIQSAAERRATVRSNRKAPFLRMGHKASYSLQAAASSLASDRRETGDRRPEGRETAKSLVGGCVGVLRGLNFEEV